MEKPGIEIETYANEKASFAPIDKRYYVANEEGALIEHGEPPAHMAYCVMGSSHLMKTMAARASKPETGGAQDVKLVEDDLLEGAKELAGEDHKNVGCIFAVPPGCSADFIKNIQALLADKMPVFYQYSPWIIPKSK